MALWTAPRDWVTGELVTAALMNTHVRDNLLTAVPLGMVLPYAAASPPNGMYLMCDGSAISRSVYSQLWTLVGVTYGPGDGSTTFNIPDIRGRAVYGVATGAPGAGSLGANEGNGTLALRGPYHPHSVQDPSHAHPTQSGPGGTGTAVPTRSAGGVDGNLYTYGAYTGIGVGSQGYSIADAPSHFALHYIIKALASNPV